MSMNIIPGGLPALDNATFAGLPLMEPTEVQYCGTLDIVLPEGFTDSLGADVNLSHGISIPAACFPQPLGAETISLAMMKWDDDSRAWGYSDVNPGTDPLYPLETWPRLPTRISDVVRQLNLHYRRPGDETAHRAQGVLTAPPVGNRVLASTVLPSTTVFYLTTPANSLFIIGHYARVGSEIVRVTAVSGVQIQVQRNRLGTSAGYHAAGTPVIYDAYCNPYHAHTTTRLDTVGGPRGTPYEKSRWTYFPGATPIAAIPNWTPIVDDEDGDKESRGFTIELTREANPSGLRDAGEVIIHLTPLTPLWAW
jgi:hypothetical protein